METRKNKNGMMNVLSAVVMVILLVMQFMPYWQYADDGSSCSVSGYVGVTDSAEQLHEDER